MSASPLISTMWEDHHPFYTALDSFKGKLEGSRLPDGSEDKIDEELTDLNKAKPVQVPNHVISRPSTKDAGKFLLLQLWEGKVVFVDEEKNEFVSVVIDKTNPEFPDEKVTLSTMEIDPNDNHLLEAGSIFYWSIGYVDTPGRPRSRVSRIRFRRLPAWSKKEVLKAKETGAALADLFSGN